MVQNLTQTGMKLQIYQASTMSLSKSIPVPNQYLPPECGDNNHRCGVLHFEHSGISYYIIPSIRGFVKLSHRIGDTQQDPQISFINVTEECNPIQAFLTGPEGSYRIVIACMDLQTRPHGVIYYLQYYFSPDTNGRSRSAIKKNTSFQIRSEPIYNPDTVSKVIYVHGQTRCEERRNLYFIDDTYVLQYSPDAFDPEYILSSTALQNCVGYQDIEHYGNDSLLIRCFNNQTVMYDSCTGRFNYLHSDHIPYPCSNWDTIVYRDGRQLMLHKRQHSNDTQLRTLFLPFDDLTYGTCIRAYDGTPIFIGIAKDGHRAILIAHFGISNVTVIEALSDKKVFRSNGSISWNQPVVFSPNRQVFGVYNADNKDFQIFNITAECNFVRHIGISDNFIPDLVMFIARNGSYTCGCQRALRLEPPSSSSTKWLSFGIPVIIIAGMLIVLGISGVIATLVYVG